MNNLLIFFALPISVIIISIALQRLLKCPWLVAAVIFAIFLIATFIIDNLNFLVATIIFTIIAFITAFITCLICRFLNTQLENSCCNGTSDDNTNILTTIQNNCNCNQNNNIRTYQITAENGERTRIDIVPNSNNNSTNGCCRRR